MKSISRKIIAIGGGAMTNGATNCIDEQIIKLTGKKKPHALFIPTATDDNEVYCNTFNKIYRDKYHCSTDLLLLMKKKYSKKQLEEKILSADIIFVGGGNTLRMMRKWRFLGVDKLLKRAWENGAVCCGSSAGALCWFNYGHSDSMFYYHPKKWNYIVVRGLGFVPALLCPHFLKEKRDEHFRNMVKKRGGMGLAVDDCAAFEIIDDKIRVITANETTNGFKVFKQNGKIIQQQLPKNGKPMLLNDLLKV